MTEPPLKSLVLVGPVPPPPGGMANQTLQLKRLLEQEGIAVSLVPVNSAYRPHWVGRIRGLRAVFRFMAYLPRLWREAGRADLFHIMANSGWSWHLFAAPAIWIAWLRGRPVVLNYRGGEAERFFERSFSWVRPSLRRTAAVIVPSEYLRDVFARRGVDAGIVPNIIDLELFREQAGESNTDGLDTGYPHIVVARHLESIYGIDVAIKSFFRFREHFPHARLSIAGQGPQRLQLEEMVNDLGISGQVTFTGSLDRKAMSELYRSGDIFLNTSTTDNMPNAILEAMACGLPVVTTDAGGIPCIVKHGVTGLVVPVGDEDKVVGALLKVAREPESAREMAARARLYVQRYGWDNVKEILFEIYRRVLGPTRCPADVVQGERK